MWYFFGGIALLVIGYLTYGRLVEKILAPDDRETPAVSKADGVDFMVLPHWKNMLIQLLNIAGIGPVIGVILGVKFGSIVFLVIPAGNIIAGAVHDFIAGMMSLRHGGANLPELTRRMLGRFTASLYSVFIVICLLLVVAVFINIPAGLIDGMTGMNCFWYAAGAIFLYYICATLFPVDKIIGSCYPLFGAVLILSSLAIFGALTWAVIKDPALLTETESFKAGMIQQPVVPVLFVTIACGIISGFHATQSPIIARTMRSERQSRSAFYGMMVAEGIIAMIWAAAAMAIYNIFPETMKLNPAVALNRITDYFLGSWVGGVTVFGVIILAVTSGDTAMRSVRLSMAEILHVEQKSITKRLLLCIPACIIVAALLWWSNMNRESFGKLWNYFAWSNQVMASVTLLAGTSWLVKQGKNSLIALVPGLFMTFIVSCYILWTSPAHGGPAGFGLELNTAYIAAGILAALLVTLSVLKGRSLRDAE